MNLLGRRAYLVGLTASRTMRAYGALREARGRLRARRSPRTRVALVVAGGAGLLAGLAGGFALGDRLGRRCEHAHDHAHDPVVVETTAEERTAGAAPAP